jgi:hypothetical protein
VERQAHGLNQIGTVSTTIDAIHLSHSERIVRSNQRAEDRDGIEPGAGLGRTSNQLVGTSVTSAPAMPAMRIDL